MSYHVLLTQVYESILLCTHVECEIKNQNVVGFLTSTLEVV